MNNSFIETIRAYYFNHFDELDTSHQFHFASRMAAWSGDQEAYKKLLGLKQAFVTPPDNLSQSEYIANLISEPQKGRRVAQELRAPYFILYPDLYGLEKALFRVRHLKYIYDVDLKEVFLSVYPLAKIATLKQSLLSDPQSLRFLSSFAVNMFYVSEIVLDHQSPKATPEFWYEVGLHYDMTSIEQVQLLIYLYTHCIIADSHFYIRSIPEDHIATYNKMLSHLEAVIDAQFEHISLDNKLEYLVATKIIRFSTKLADRIYYECRQSISTKGNFIIERHNQNLRPDRQTFIKSEHRNVLLIMSGSDFSPHNTLATD